MELHFLHLLHSTDMNTTIVIGNGNIVGNGNTFDNTALLRVLDVLRGQQELTARMMERTDRFIASIENDLQKSFVREKCRTPRMKPNKSEHTEPPRTYPNISEHSKTLDHEQKRINH